MVWQWCRFAAAAGCFAVGLGFMLVAVFGVNRFRLALNRMHAAALGDTLGILFIFLGLVVMRGFTLDSLKLVLVILFFWMASPVSGHMISRLEAMTDQHLGEIEIIRKRGANAGNQENVVCKTDNRNDVDSNAGICQGDSRDMVCGAAGICEGDSRDGVAGICEADSRDMVCGAARICQGETGHLGKGGEDTL